MGGGGGARSNDLVLHTAAEHRIPRGICFLPSTKKVSRGVRMPTDQSKAMRVRSCAPIQVRTSGGLFRPGHGTVECWYPSR
jgi:hypothetical protein